MDWRSPLALKDLRQILQRWKVGFPTARPVSACSYLNSRDELVERPELGILDVPHSPVVLHAHVVPAFTLKGRRTPEKG